ncbi:low molecular weight protein-tyrosine-phosphatase [Sulfurovum sp. CS9]|uniref:low molecular weight protein-tyrosine-phosphatase n=1 Tax=Sulfurovum sp. CS9 TaxID=3391146 RepID=UPI0039ECD702
MLSRTRILFVCLGNICRSPLAEGVAQYILEKEGLKLVVDSAGTSNWHEGEAPCDHSIKIARQNKVDISQQRSRPVTKQDIKDFDYVIAMDAQNKSDLENFGFTNVYKLGDFGDYKGANVPDPYFFPGFEGFEKVFKMVDVCVKDFLEQECR